MVLSGKKRPLLLIPVIIILFTLWVHYTRITSSVRIGVSLNLSETADPSELHMEQGIELAADILNEKRGFAPCRSLNRPFRFKTAFSNSHRRRKQRLAHHYSGTRRYRYVDGHLYRDPLQLRVYRSPHLCGRRACHGSLRLSKTT